MTRFTLTFPTRGDTEVVNLSKLIAKSHAADLAGEGVLHLFAVGSTAALTTLEFEPGLVDHDVRALFQHVAPDDALYHHEATWNDDNGHSHLRALLLGPSLTVPFANGKLLTGEWQQVVFVDFDTRPRKRTVVCSVLS